MFLTKLRTLCNEADWIVQCGHTLNGYKLHYGRTAEQAAAYDAVAIWDADIDALYVYARAVVAAGRRSSVRQHRWIGDAIAVAIETHSADEIIDTFAGIV